MSYAGSYNGFSFGDKQRPGASVASLTGWRVNRRDPGSDVRLGLNLHADTPEQLDDLIDRALAAFVPSTVHLPLTIGGRTKWVQVVDATPVTAPEWPGPEKNTLMPVAFTAKDPTLYGPAVTAKSILAGAPVSSTSFEAANPGRLVADAPRAYEFSLTAATNWVNPKVRVDHDDGTFEQIVLSGLTVTAGNTLTLGADRLPRVGTQIVSSYQRSTTQTGGPSRAPRPLLLHPSDGTDGANQVTVSGSSGTFYGTCLVRGTF